MRKTKRLIKKRKNKIYFLKEMDGLPLFVSLCHSPSLRLQRNKTRQRDIIERPGALKKNFMKIKYNAIYLIFDLRFLKLFAK